jgi:hypothetical protein
MRSWLLMATGGFKLDVPDTATNAAAFGYADREDRSAYPKVRVVTIGECGSHAKVDARIGPAGGKGSGEIRRALPAFGTTAWRVSVSILLSGQSTAISPAITRRKSWALTLRDQMPFIADAACRVRGPAKPGHGD